MTEVAKRYRRKPAEIQAAQVAEHTAEAIALWCGGSWGHERDRGVDSYLEIIVPNVKGNLKARVNNYVVRKGDGRFYVMTEDEMVAEDYIEITAYRQVGSRSEVLHEAAVEGVLPPAPEQKTPHYVRRGQHPFGALG